MDEKQNKKNINHLSMKRQWFSTVKRLSQIERFIERFKALKVS
jgi:hypothetical protein